MKPGIWLLASLNSHGTTKGMRLKFQDVKCYRDNQYEYSDYDNDDDNLANKEFNIWNPLSLETIKENEKKPVLVEKTNGESDDYTAMLANEMGFRSFKKQSNTSDVDLLDLSFLDYEVVDVSNDTQPHFTRSKRQSFTAEITGLNDKSLSTRLDGPNLTGVDFFNQLITKNATALQNSSASAFLNHSVNKKQKKNIPPADQPQNASTATKSSSSVRVAEFQTATAVLSASADGRKTPLSFPKANVGKNNSIDRHSTSSQDAHGPHLNSSEKVNPFISKYEIDTDVLLKNSSVTANLSTSNAVNNEQDRSSSLKQPFNVTVVSSVPSLFNNEIVTNTSKEFGDSESIEEVFIFVKDKNAGAIKTTSVKTSGHNWSYDGTHQIVPVEITDQMKKYVEKSPQTNKKKRTKKVTLPHRPQKGQGMKTKRRKEYKPQPRSGLPFSPRGFNPIMSPRGARPLGLQPVNDEENLVNMPVVIGVPRPDFSDYELYLPGDEPDHLGLDDENVKPNEYEYVSYKDPYSSDEDAKNFHLDQATNYLKNPDKDVRTYFIAAEEVQWDYAGYGQR